ncbi:MAG: hypothetical protein AAF806_19300 [Bacteroidota bacterium]
MPIEIPPIRRRYDDSGGFDNKPWKFNFASLGPMHPNRPPKTQQCFTVSEVNSKISSLKNSLENEINSLKTELNQISTELSSKIDSSLNNINSILGQLPDIIKSDLEFRKTLKDEIIAEIKTELENE